MTTSKLSGKYLVIDIGKVETKILEATISSSSIKIHNAVDMKDMTPFVPADSRTLGNIRGFCESLRATLDSYAIKTNRVLICSSVLGIRPTWEDKTSQQYKDTKELDKYYQEQIGRATSNLSISDYKIYGTLPSETELRYRIMKQKANLSLLNDLVKNLHEVGLTVVGLESTASASLNLEVMFPYSYDMPALILMDFGSMCSITIFKEGARATGNNLNPPLCDLVSTMSRELGIPPIRIKRYLYKIGYIRNSGSEQELYNENVDADQYFGLIQSAIKRTYDILHKAILDIVKSQNLGNYRIVMSGGLMDIPGVYPAVEALWNDVPLTSMYIESVMQTKTFAITNKMNAYCANKYANCIGVLLGNCMSKRINLVPQEAVSIDTNSSVIMGFKAITGMLFVGCAGLAVLCAIGLFNMWNYRNVQEYLTQTQSQLSSVQSLDNKYKTYIQILDQVDVILFPLTEFITQYSDSNLKIASVDTPDMLKTSSIEENAAVVDSTTDPAASQTTDGTSTETTEGSADTTVSTDTTVTTETPVFVNQDIVIRGYATDSKSITDFFNKLQAQEWVPDLRMEGVKQISLNAEESFYIFEIRIVREV